MNSIPAQRSAEEERGKAPTVGLLREIFEGRPDLQIPGVRGTLWGAYNAVTRFEDYKQPQQEELGPTPGAAWLGEGQTSS